MNEKVQKIGRPITPKHLKRVPCHGIRLPAYWLFWLSNQPESSGRLIEESLEGCYGYKLDRDKLFAEFYRRN